jgi:hypothetical protein
VQGLHRPKEKPRPGEPRTEFLFNCTKPPSELALRCPEGFSD